MSPRRSQYSAHRMRRTSREVRSSTLGTHVVRPGPDVRQREGYIREVRRRARLRRAATAVVAVLVVVAVAVAAGFFAFRGVLGSEMALKDSDAAEALVAVRSGEPYYTLISAELGATAAPLDNAGPDVVLLARITPGEKALSLVNIPANLPVVSGDEEMLLGDTASLGDGALIGAVSTFAKVDISHYVKLPRGGVSGIVRALGGVEVQLDQVIDDPHAGDAYLPEGSCVLDADTALVYLRAENLKLGVQDKLAHQLGFASLVIERLFSASGNFDTRLESIDSFFQTDYSLSDLENMNSWLSGISASEIVTASLPGYNTAITSVSESDVATFVGTASDMADIIEALEAGEGPEAVRTDQVSPAAPDSFTVEVQNGTTILGAAGVTGEALSSRGFNVVAVGNAEQQIYEETLVVYKGDEGLARARAVIDALGVGRAVSGEAYYSFDPDVLVIIGADYKPVS